VTTLPDDSIDEHPDMLAIAREMPEFGGFYFNDRGDLEVALTNTSRLADATSRIRPLLGIHRTARGIVDRTTARFVARSVQYTFLELARYRTVLRRYVFSIPEVVSLDLSESDNRVKIGIAQPGADQEVRTLLAKLEIP
jgi:hypothetical protein